MKRSYAKAVPKGVTKKATKPAYKKQKVYKPSLLISTSPVETKAVDTNFLLPFGNENSNSGKIVLINDMNQGSEAYQRIGRKIHVKGIKVRGIVYPDTSISPNDVLVIYLFYATAPNGVPPSNYTDLFDGVEYSAGTATGTTSYRPFQFRNLENVQRFQVMKRHVMRITDTDEMISNQIKGSDIMNIDWNIPCDIITMFDNIPVSGRSGSVISGGVFMAVQGLTANSASTPFYFQGTCRCTYEDC